MRAALVLLALVAALLTGGRAFAHAQLVAADPPAGAVLAAAPGAAVLTFSEPVHPLAFRWFPPHGEAVDARPVADGVRVTVPLPADAGTGTLLLSWRVASGDGHPVGGSHAFSIGAASGAAGAEADAGAGQPGGQAALAALARGCLTLALVFGVGGTLFLRFVDRGRPGRVAPALARGAVLAVPPLAVVALGLHGLDLLGGAPGDLLTAAPWRAALASPFAAMAAVASLAAAVAVPRAGPCAAILAWAFAATSFALFGHAATAAPRWLTAPSVAIHAAAFIFWIGALPGLAEAAARPDAALAPTLRRFSALAVPLVVLLVLTGTTLAVVQVRTPAALVDTAYGRLLMLKLAAVALLIGLAGFNRIRLTPAIERGEAGAAPRFRRSAMVEFLLGLVILGLASGFRLTPPPRAIEAAASEAYVHLHGPTVMADVTLRPGRPGANRVEIVLMSPEGSAVDPLEVRISFADPARGIEPIRLDATRDGLDWAAGPITLPAGGHWTVRLDVLVSDFVKDAIEADVTLPGG